MTETGTLNILMFEIKGICIKVIMKVRKGKMSNVKNKWNLNQSEKTPIPREKKIFTAQFCRFIHSEMRTFSPFSH